MRALLVAATAFALQQPAQMAGDTATALHQAGRLEEAMAAYDDAARRSPRDHNSLYGRGVLLRQMGRLGESVASMRRVVRTLPTPRLWLAADQPLSPDPSATPDRLACTPPGRR